MITVIGFRGNIGRCESQSPHAAALGSHIAASESTHDQNLQNQLILSALDSRPLGSMALYFVDSRIDNGPRCTMLSTGIHASSHQGSHQGGVDQPWRRGTDEKYPVKMGVFVLPCAVLI